MTEQNIKIGINHLREMVADCSSGAGSVAIEIDRKLKDYMETNQISRETYLKHRDQIVEQMAILGYECHCKKVEEPKFFPKDMKVMSVKEVFETYEKEGYEPVEKDIGGGMIEHSYVKKK